MFHIYVASVCSKCFIYFRLMLQSSVSYFNGMSRESWDKVGCWQPIDGACWGSCRRGELVLGSRGQGELVLILGPVHVEREKRVRGRSGGHDVSCGRA
jgi:hypothetical protein